jgi:hypothetical protein
MNIRLRIDRLVLDGLPVTGADGLRVKAAVEAELGRLLSQGGVSNDLAAGGALPRVAVPTVQFTHGSSPSQFGTQIAQSVFSGIGKS